MQLEDTICLLKNKNMTISTMESCTGGSICHYITNIIGCSKVLIGGYITYTNEQKIRCGVPKEIIDKYGVYSKECAVAMATACLKNTNSDISIGVTGTLANKDKNNSDSIIGVIYYSIIVKNKIYSEMLKLDDNLIKWKREYQKEFIVNDIMKKLKNILEEDKNV